MVQCSSVQYGVVQYIAAQCSAVQCSAVQCSAVQCSAVQCSAVRCGVLQCLPSVICLQTPGTDPRSPLAAKIYGSGQHLQSGQHHKATISLPLSVSPGGCLKPGRAASTTARPCIIKTNAACTTGLRPPARPGPRRANVVINQLFVSAPAPGRAAPCGPALQEAGGVSRGRTAGLDTHGLEAQQVMTLRSAGENEPEKTGNSEEK